MCVCMYVHVCLFVCVCVCVCDTHCTYSTYIHVEMHLLMGWLRSTLQDHNLMFENNIHIRKYHRVVMLLWIPKTCFVHSLETMLSMKTTF